MSQGIYYDDYKSSESCLRISVNRSRQRDISFENFYVSEGTLKIVVPVKIIIIQCSFCPSSRQIMEYLNSVAFNLDNSIVNTFLRYLNVY